MVYNESSTAVPVYEQLVITCSKETKFNKQQICSKLGLKMYEAKDEAGMN